MREGAAPSAFVAAAFETVLGRPPSSEESDRAAEFLVEQATLLQEPIKLTAFGVASNKGKPSNDPAMRARENLVHVLFNHNDFVTVR